jgi:phosphatidate phosphatase
MIEYGLIPTIQTGFYCDDPKISHKFSGDTINGTILISFTFLIPLFGVSWQLVLEDFKKQKSYIL